MINRKRQVVVGIKPQLEMLEDRVVPSVASDPLELALVGRYDTGLPITNAEIVAYDPATQRLFVNNSTAGVGQDDIDIVSISNPAAPAKIGGIDFNFAGFAGSNSAAFKNGILAVSIEASTKTNPGIVAFYDANGAFLGQANAGALPDMLTFTPDGTKVLVANEGEPNSYNQVGSIDPEGSVTIIDISGGIAGATVSQVSFAGHNGNEAALRALGIRIFGPNATAAQDFEPEYITTDGVTAWVTLQENNALAIIEIASAVANPATFVPTLKPLGLKNHNVAHLETFTFDLSGESAGISAAGQTVPFGGFSGLFFEGYAVNGNMKFITHTDRGPNGEPSGQNRPFIVPNFNPTLMRFELNRSTGQLTITQKIGLKDNNGNPLTGLPNINRAADPGLTLEQTPNNDEIAVDLTGAPLADGLDPLSGDFEGIVVDTDGSFWMCDEYRPAIYHFDSNGVLIDRFVPFGTHAAAGVAYAPGTFGTYGTEALPAVLAQRRQNRGFEAIAQHNGKIYAFVQSPNRNPSTQANGALNAQTNVRLVEFDPITKATRQFIYQMDNLASVSAADTRADKIGDMLSIGNGDFLVVERDDDAIGSDPAATIQKKVYRFNLAGATAITPANDILYSGKTLDQMTAAELTTAGISAIKKSLHVDLNTAGYNTIEKVEGLALVDAYTIAVVNDNDFGVGGATINPAGTFSPTGVPTIVGLITTNNLDASDRDGPGNNPTLNIRPWPVMGMYQPDAIANFTIGGNTFLVTANEGDARDYTGFVEEARVGDAGYALDTGVFTEADLETNNDKLSRLTVSIATGNTDADSQYEEIHVFGSRSFSVRDAAGNLLWDSGDAFEQITSLALPTRFNASNDNNDFDNRSDNKGPEPEGITVGVVNGKTYAFIALERVGGIMVFDVSTPAIPKFVQYLNTRNFAVAPLDPAAGEVGSEGIIFISAADSPIGRPLVITANEVSASIGVFQVLEANLVFNAPSGAAANDMTLRLNGTDLELIDNADGKILLRQPLDKTSSLAINGVNGESETVTVDFAFGGAFALPAGAVFNGGTNATDMLGFKGTTGADSAIVSGPQATFNGTLVVTWTGLEVLSFDTGAGNDQFSVAGQPLSGSVVELEGGGDNDTYTLGTISTRVRITDSAGSETLDFTPSSVGVAVNLALSAGQLQDIDILGNRLQLVGVIEHLIGSYHSDILLGNSAANNIWAMGGHDFVYAAGGDDYVDGGEGNDAIFGDGGNDILLGRAGNDLIIGGAGRDLVIGGMGFDILFGNSDGDILIAGSTVHNNNRAALDSVLAVWASNLSYKKRVQLLNGGLLASGNLIDDFTLNILFGGSALDWLLN